MEGYLKKWTSIFRGYQDRWVIITTEGYLNYYETEPPESTEPPRGRLHLALAEIERRDSHRFKVSSNDGQKFYFKAGSEDEAENWITAMETTQSSITEDDLSDGTGQKADEKDEVDSGSDNIVIKEDIQQVQQQSQMSRKHDSFKDVVKTIMTAEDITAHFRKLMIESKRKNFQVVAAIDFGSSYTGCAFSFKSEYKKDPLKIHMVALSEKNLRSNKEPTVLLLNQEGQFDSFGSKAEEKYTELEQNDPVAAKDWYFFRRFKMQLYNNKDLSRVLNFKDIAGKSIKAVDVFALCIEYIKDIIFKKIKQERSEMREYDVRWVLTCPAMWNESARQFMIEAGEKGGIDQQSMTLVLEPEAAAMCCKCIEAKKGDDDEFTMFSAGSRFLIIDLGGGAVDITANEVLETGQLREIYNASGGPWGGNMINQKIWILIHDVFGNAVVQNFMNEFRDDYLGMIRAVELKKQNVDFDSKFIIDIPETLFNEAKKLNADVSYDKNRDLVKIVKSKLQIDSRIIRDIFKECIDTLCRHVSHLLQKDETRGVSRILMVGGYSSCELLQKTMKETFPKMQLLYPDEPDTIVLKGAVIMGHMNTPIAKRIAKYHYGIAVYPEIDLAMSFNGSIRAPTDVESEFHVFIEKGSPIKVNDVIAEYDVPVNPEQEKVIIEVYASDLETPPDVVSEDSCRKIGTIRIKLNGFDDESMLKVGISCDGTEFKAVARDFETGRCFAGICRFLE